MIRGALILLAAGAAGCKVSRLVFDDRACQTDDDCRRFNVPDDPELRRHSCCDGPIGRRCAPSCPAAPPADAQVDGAADRGCAPACAAPPESDHDCDEFPDQDDNCPDCPNDQVDVDGDGAGDVCDCDPQDGLFVSTLLEETLGAAPSGLSAPEGHAGCWAPIGGRMARATAPPGGPCLRWAGAEYDLGRQEARVRVRAVEQVGDAGSYPYGAAGVLFRTQNLGGGGFGLFCGIAPAVDVPRLVLVSFNEKAGALQAVAGLDAAGTPAEFVPAPGANARFVELRATADGCCLTCTALDAGGTGAVVELSGCDPRAAGEAVLGSGSFGLLSVGLVADFADMTACTGETESQCAGE